MTEQEPRSRQWIATLFPHMVHVCLETTMRNLTDTGRVRFIAFGEEVCPTTGTCHYQAYLVFYQPQQLSRCIKLFGNGHHFEIMRGSLRQNEEYCNKEGSFHKLGDEPKQGERHDIIGFTRLIDQGMRPTDICIDNEMHRPAFVKYHGGFDKYAHAVRERTVRTDRTMPKVYIRIASDTGSGKTRWLDEQFGLDGWARMPNPTGNWWITPAVSYSDTVLVDDVGPEKIPKVEEFLEWTDRYPIEFNSKGGHLWWKPKNIVFTSNCHPNEWWPKIIDAHKAAVERRIFRIDLVYKDRPVESFYPNGQDGV